MSKANAALAAVLILLGAMLAVSAINRSTGAFIAAIIYGEKALQAKSPDLKVIPKEGIKFDAPPKDAPASPRGNVG